MTKLSNSFSHALRGIRTVFKEEVSFRIQIIFAVLVIAALAVFPVSGGEFALLLVLVFSVLVLEVLNSIIERIADMVQPRLHEGVRVIKDMMAGAVLLSSLGAGIIGIFLLWPYIAAFEFRF